MPMPTLTQDTVTRPVNRPGYEVADLPLNNLETCDRCGPAVSATTRVITFKGDLMFCTHHALVFGFRTW